MKMFPATFKNDHGVLIGLRFWERERGFVIGFTHHPVTSVGIGISLYFGWWSYNFAIATRKQTP